MPKMKTKKAVQKRFKLTRHGKVKMNKAGRRHLMTTKNGKRLRKLRKQVLVQGKQAKTMAQLIAPNQ